VQQQTGLQASCRRGCSCITAPQQPTGQGCSGWCRTCWAWHQTHKSGWRGSSSTC
jgi:hypothetical protein